MIEEYERKKKEQMKIDEIIFQSHNDAFIPKFDKVRLKPKKKKY